MKGFAALLAILVSLTCQADTSPLPSWQNTASRQAIIAFVERVTSPSLPDHVEPSARIAVFDNDGTLWLSSRCTPRLFVADRIQAQADDNPTWQTQEPFARY
ncbi:hypothetical protein ULG90_21905 [Halopseudomonas pachastrellae]|nr:hypothetical protein ULG90_21905 [Halopseudomonas pachastrellae]